MIKANARLVLFLIVFWGLLAVGIKFSNWWHGKRWSDGPALFPVIRMIGVAAGIIGWLVNYFASPWGIYCIAGLYAGGLSFRLY